MWDYCVSCWSQIGFHRTWWTMRHGYGGRSEAKCCNVIYLARNHKQTKTLNILPVPRCDDIHVYVVITILYPQDIGSSERSLGYSDLRPSYVQIEHHINGGRVYHASLDVDIVWSSATRFLKLIEHSNIIHQGYILCLQKMKSIEWRNGTNYYIKKIQQIKPNCC